MICSKPKSKAAVRKAKEYQSINVIDDHSESDYKIHFKPRRNYKSSDPEPPKCDTDEPTKTIQVKSSDEKAITERHENIHSNSSMNNSINGDRRKPAVVRFEEPAEVESLQPAEVERLGCLVPCDEIKEVYKVYWSRKHDQVVAKVKVKRVPQVLALPGVNMTG